MRSNPCPRAITLAAILLGTLTAGASGCTAAPAAPKRTSSAAQSNADGNGVTVGWIGVVQSESYGLVSATVDKVYPSDQIAGDCGGAYSITASIDVGAVGDDSIEIRSVTFFYNANSYEAKPREWMDVYSNGTPNVHAYGDRMHDENGVLYQTYPLETTFHGVRRDSSHAIVIEGFVAPGAPYIPGFGGESICGTTAKFALYIE